MPTKAYAAYAHENIRPRKPKRHVLTKAYAHNCASTLPSISAPVSCSQLARQVLMGKVLESKGAQGLDLSLLPAQQKVYIIPYMFECLCVPAKLR